MYHQPSSRAPRVIIIKIRMSGMVYRVRVCAAGVIIALVVNYKAVLVPEV